MHAYALVKPSNSALNLPEGVVSCLELVGCGQLAAVIERDLILETLQEDDAALLQAVLAHDRVIRELFAQITVLPLRFASFPTLEALLSNLQTQQNQYLEAINQLEGKAEYTIQLTPVEIQAASIPVTLKGKDYFLAKKQQYQEQQQQQELQTQELAQIYHAIAQRYPTHANPDTHQLHILSERNSSPQLHEEIAMLQVRFKTWRFLLSSEALPPFHFV